ncbi:hypothetical protein B0H17DRAFT_1101730 [Mycena rosella]|uniref:Uncharacterized protein n=1 Tax=Mycena rosella TaxID=1033263 RepID=A0AAD7CLM5_MYCRO|nr:hypothetical protein B0H17DRAFT_1101730 [Mycena rosella]
MILPKLTALATLRLTHIIGSDLYAAPPPSRVQSSQTARARTAASSARRFWSTSASRLHLLVSAVGTGEDQHYG